MTIPAEEAYSASHHLSSSFSPLSSSRHFSSPISQVYKQASTLFLTRRLSEALSTIEPLILPHISSEELTSDREVDEDVEIKGAPVTRASRNSRVKVWSLYISLLNSIVELGLEEGKTIFGGQRWRGLTSKAREGTVWEEVVRDGYGGIEGDVDPEVVINLTTLLLSHARTQSQTQSRLETYLSASSHLSLDISAHLSSATSKLETSQAPRRRSPHNNGTNTPRDLASRIKILELYTLHVLPRNSEWDYAHDFISMSETLDEERREAFLQALQGLKEEQNQDLVREKALMQERDNQLQSERAEAEIRRVEAEEERAREERLRTEKEATGVHKGLASETDYGIEGSQRNGSSKPRLGTNDRSKPSEPAHTNKSQLPPKPRTPAQARTAVGMGSKGLYKRTASMMVSLQKSLIDMAHSMSGNPMALLRMVFFLVGLVLAFGRSDIRDRLKRITGLGWDKVRGTVGMGVKVSYI
ncbi:MAG: hypothetical protein M1836_001064 [Candelina mexicana]|nr:MAG: hypothetical protein M1836_001064 [Candelina mexicana]